MSIAVCTLPLYTQPGKSLGNNDTRVQMRQEVQQFGRLLSITVDRKFYGFYLDKYKLCVSYQSLGEDVLKWIVRMNPKSMFREIYRQYDSLKYLQ